MPVPNRGNFQAQYAVGGMPGLLTFAQGIQVPQLDDAADCHLFGVEVIDTSSEPPMPVLFGTPGDAMKPTTYKLDQNVTVVLHYFCP